MGLEDALYPRSQMRQMYIFYWNVPWKYKFGITFYFNSISPPEDFSPSKNVYSSGSSVGVNFKQLHYLCSGKSEMPQIVIYLRDCILTYIKFLTTS